MKIVPERQVKDLPDAKPNALVRNAGYRVRALVRAGSEKKLPLGCEVVIGDPLDATSFANKIGPCDTFIQLN